MPSDLYVQLSTAGLNRALDQEPTFHTGWDDTVMWVQNLRDAMDYDRPSWKNPFVHEVAKTCDFNALVR